MVFDFFDRYFYPTHANVPANFLSLNSHSKQTVTLTNAPHPTQRHGFFARFAANASRVAHDPTIDFADFSVTCIMLAMSVSV